jgi:hypothetical protein
VAIYRLAQNVAFGPDEIQSMGKASESTLRVLGLTERNDPINEIVAKKIIEIAHTGERNPQRLSALAIQQLGIPVTIPPKAS